MRKGSDLIGKPIITYDTGEQIDKIQDLIVDPETNKLIGLLVDEGGWFSTARVLPYAGIRAIGPDAAIALSKTLIVEASTIPEIDRVLQADNVLRGKKIMTAEGRNLGILIDLFFDEETGTVEGYEVSGGLFGEIDSAHSFVPAPRSLKLGEDVAFVPSETLNLMEEENNPQPRLQTLQKAVDSSTCIPKTSSDLSLEQIKGKRVRHSVRTAKGLFIAVPGQIVTDRTIERARTHHQEQALLEAVGIQPKLATPSPVNESDRLYQKSLQAKIQATNLWEQVIDKVTDLQEQGLQALENRRIKAALGRPVTRVILDDRDRVILNIGELITHQAIAQARQAGVLDILLNSVDSEEPEISKAELRATEPGNASLESHPQPLNLPPVSPVEESHPQP